MMSVTNFGSMHSNWTLSDLDKSHRGANAYFQGLFARISASLWEEESAPRRRLWHFVALNSMRATSVREIDSPFTVANTRPVVLDSRLNMQPSSMFAGAAIESEVALSNCAP